MIKVITFDFGNVIYKLNNKQFIITLCKYSPLGFKKLYNIVLNSEDYDLFEAGKISFDEYFKRVIKKGKLKIDKEKFVNLHNNRLTIIPSTISLIKKLCKNYKLILLSNASIIDFKFVIRKSPVYKYFKYHIISCKLGYMKPYAPTYLELIRLANVQPNEILFIDDKKVNVDGARKLGIKAIQYKNFENLEKDLKKLRIIL
ncbi:HAD family phosphatase [Candidatus Woesearchaeota archaeon]|nr:HAD family phosphatase [Candidatus Woesearchaeota archaeon]